jgi:hypothetical protein
MKKYTKTKVLINLLVLSFATQAYAYTCPKEFCEQTIANLQELKLIAKLQSGTKLPPPKVKAHGFYNPANSNQVFDNFKEGKMNGKSFTKKLVKRNALYPTRQCALFHHLRRDKYKNEVDKKWGDRTSSTELCGKIDIDDFNDIGDAKQVMTELSATFLNLFLMSVYGPASGAQVFIPMAIYSIFKESLQRCKPIWCLER